MQPELCVEAVRLARALAQHPMTAGPASDALAALLALTAARLSTRVGPDGVAQLLEDQPRDQWDHGLIALGLAHLDARRGRRGADGVASARRDRLAACHGAQRRRRPTGRASPRSTISSLALDPSPVVALARAVAIGRAEGAAAGLGGLAGDRAAIPTAEAARGVFLSELGRATSARAFRERRDGACPHRAGAAARWQRRLRDWVALPCRTHGIGSHGFDAGRAMIQTAPARITLAAHAPVDRRRRDPAECAAARFQGDGEERHGGQRDQVGLHAGVVDGPEAEPSAGRAEQQAGQRGVEPEVDAAEGIAAAAPTARP